MQLAPNMQVSYTVFPVISFNRDIEWNFLEKQILIQSLNQYYVNSPTFYEHINSHGYNNICVVKPLHFDEDEKHTSYHFNIMLLNTSNKTIKSPTIHAYFDYKKLCIHKMTLIQEL